jgi:integrase
VLAVLRRGFGPRLLQDIDGAAIVAWQQQRLQETAGARGKFGPKTARRISPATVNRETDVLRALLQAAVPKYLRANPAAGLRRLRVPRQSGETRILRPDEEARLYAALKPSDRALVIVAIDTLARLSDVTWLRRDQDHGTYLVLPNTKTGWHEVPLSSRARQALDDLPDRGPYYFAHRVGPTRERHHVAAIVRRMFERACLRANVPYGKRRGGVTFHHLRHTGASRMIERGADVRTVQQIGGWSDLRMVQRYTHPTASALRAAVELIAQTPAPTEGDPR